MSVILRWLKRLEVRKGLILLISSLPLMLMLKRADPEPSGYMLLGEIIEKYLPVPWISIMVNILILLILIGLMYSKKPDTNFRKMIRDVLGGNIGTVFGLTALILELVLIGWITDYLREGIYWAAASSALMFFNILMLFMLMTSVPRGRHVKRVPEKKKILIFALSIPKINPKSGSHSKQYCNDYWELMRCIILEKLSKQNHDENCKNMLKNCNTNLELPARYIAYHLGTVEKVLILVSKNGSDRYYKDFVCTLKGAIPRKDSPTFQMIGPADFNNYQEILDCIKNALKKIFQEGYTDRDISFMISPGTSAVTAALIISAVRDGRQVEYFTQDEKKELISIDVNILDVRRLFGGDID